MFNPKSTVFITGAGASCHYGYPSGEELVHRVQKSAHMLAGYFDWIRSAIKRVPSDIPIFISEALVGDRVASLQLQQNELKQVSEQCKALAGKLQAVDPLVIDDFLGRNEDLSRVGKLLIAWVILAAEDEQGTHPIRSGGKKDNWCRFIIHSLTSDCTAPSDILNNKVTFITFNYDVSLERNIYRALRSIQYFAEPDLIKSFFSKIPFIHVYGKIRDDSTAPPDAFKSKTFGNYIDNERDSRIASNQAIDAAYRASLGLRTISPHEKTARPEIQIAADAVHNADQVYILGYGFDHRNSALLKLGDYLRHDSSSLKQERRHKSIYFTNYHDHNTINKRASRLFVGHPRGFLSTVAPVQNLSHMYYEKSVKDVYSAFSEDFDTPDDKPS